MRNKVEDSNHVGKVANIHPDFFFIPVRELEKKFDLHDQAEISVQGRKEEIVEYNDETLIEIVRGRTQSDLQEVIKRKVGHRLRELFSRVIGHHPVSDGAYIWTTVANRTCQKTRKPVVVFDMGGLDIPHKVPIE